MSARARQVLRALPALVLAIAWAVSAGCGGSGMSVHGPSAAGALRERLVVLPLENLSSRAEYGDRINRIVWTEMGRASRFLVVDPGEAEVAMNDARVRNASLLTRDQILKVSARLDAHWLMGGSLIECGSVRTPDGEVPSVSIALRLIDGRTGQVVWADMRARSGEDRETIFGWGRVTNLERLAETTARELIQNIRIPAGADSLAHGGSRR